MDGKPRTHLSFPRVLPANNSSFFFLFRAVTRSFCIEGIESTAGPRLGAHAKYSKDKKRSEEKGQSGHVDLQKDDG